MARAVKAGRPSTLKVSILTIFLIPVIGVNLVGWGSAIAQLLGYL